MRFKIDENLPANLAELLRQGGHDAVSAVAQNLGGARDFELASACRRERRVIVTLDKDFCDVRDYPPDQYWGIVVIRLRRQGIRQIQRAIERLLRDFRATSLDGKLYIVSDSSVRVTT